MAVQAALDKLLDNFYDYLLLEHGLSEHTLDAYRSDVALFARWLYERAGTKEETEAASPLAASALTGFSADDVNAYEEARSGLSRRSAARRRAKSNARSGRTARASPLPPATGTGASSEAPGVSRTC